MTGREDAGVRGGGGRRRQAAIAGAPAQQPPAAVAARPNATNNTLNEPPHPRPHTHRPCVHCRSRPPRSLDRSDHRRLDLSDHRLYRAKSRRPAKLHQQLRAVEPVPTRWPSSLTAAQEPRKSSTSDASTAPTTARSVDARRNSSSSSAPSSGPSTIVRRCVAQRRSRDNDQTRKPRRPCRLCRLSQLSERAQ